MAINHHICYLYENRQTSLDGSSYLCPIVCVCASEPLTGEYTTLFHVAEMSIRFAFLQCALHDESHSGDVTWASWHLKFEGNHLMSGEFPSQIASYADSISISSHHYEYVFTNQYQPGSLGILIQQRQMRINPSYHPIKLTPQMIAYNSSNKNSKPHIVILLWDESSQHRANNEVRVIMGYLRYETQHVTATPT